MHRLIAVIVAASLSFGFLFSVPANAADCQFVLGFKALHNMIPAVVGDCKTNEYHNPDNGDGLQETTGANGKGGLLVWRKSDNWTAYTDGYWSWVNGPYGLQRRLNAERFTWEVEQTVMIPADTPTPTATASPPAPTATPIPQPTATPVPSAPSFQCYQSYHESLNMSGLGWHDYHWSMAPGDRLTITMAQHPADQPLVVSVNDYNGRQQYREQFYASKELVFVAPYTSTFKLTIKVPQVFESVSVEVDYQLCVKR